MTRDTNQLVSRELPPPPGYLGRDQQKDKVKTEEVKPEEDITVPNQTKD